MASRKVNRVFQIFPFSDLDEEQAYALGLHASNGAFSGYTEADFDRDQFRRVGAQLRDFPVLGLQSEVEWELRGWRSGGVSRLRFYIRDGVGHAGIHAVLTHRDDLEMETATFFLHTEVAAINLLGKHLLAWGDGHRWDEEFELQLNP